MTLTPFFWLIFIAVLIIIEIITTGLTTIWFAGGALVSFVLCLAGAPIWLQVLAFVVVSVLLLIFTRPIAMRHFNNSRHKTNINSMIGKKGKVRETINNIEQTGKIVIGDVSWTARAHDADDIIEVDTIVEIERVEGVTVYVRAVEA